MMKQVLYSLMMFALCNFSKGQTKTDGTKYLNTFDIKSVIIPNGPGSISRTIEQDQNGNIWIAAFDGIFRYDGKSFTNMISKVSSARFFSVLQDRKGQMWFGSIGAGAFVYNGNSYNHLTTKEGLPNNKIVSIYEDKAGNIWLGANGGVSRYDGKSFRNFMMQRDSMSEDTTGETVPDFTRPPNEVNAIIEDRTGKFWFATRGNTFVYDGKKFTVVTNYSKTFKNVRTLVEDKKGNIWLGGGDGLWRYDGSTFVKVTNSFVGYVYEDRKGNIWTGSDEGAMGWALSRYDEKLLHSDKPSATQIRSHEGMIFGILEASDGNIWFGTLNGVSRYDGMTVTDFKNPGVKKY